MMNLQKKRGELYNLISSFLDNQSNIKELQSFAWEVIDYFTKNPVKELPPEESFENVFWYAIWQIQHLCTEDHVMDGSAYRELKKILEYLKGTKPLPKDCFGKRPTR